MTNKDSVSISGYVTIIGYNKAGEVVFRSEGANMVVTDGKYIMAQLLAIGAGALIVDGIGFGSSAVPPTLADTTLTDGFLKELGTIDYPDSNSVRWEWSLDYAEGNGLNIREMGLIAGEGTADTLFARTVRDSIVKTSDLRLEGTWKITF